MEDHKKLKEICDKIWYEDKNWYYNEEAWFHFWYSTTLMERAEVIQIIFTPEFIKALEDYIATVNAWDEYDNWESFLVSHLDDPVEYIFTLLKRQDVRSKPWTSNINEYNL